MTEYVRIRLDNGREAAVPADYAEAVGATVLDAPAVNAYGRPLPASDGTKATAKKTASKEASK